MGIHAELNSVLSSTLERVQTFEADLVGLPELGQQQWWELYDRVRDLWENDVVEVCYVGKSYDSVWWLLDPARQLQQATAPSAPLGISVVGARPLRPDLEVLHDGRDPRPRLPDVAYTTRYLSAREVQEVDLAHSSLDIQALPRVANHGSGYHFQEPPDPNEYAGLIAHISNFYRSAARAGNAVIVTIR